MDCCLTGWMTTYCPFCAGFHILYILTVFPHRCILHRKNYLPSKCLQNTVEARGVLTKAMPRRGCRLLAWHPSPTLLSPACHSNGVQVIKYKDDGRTRPPHPGTRRCLSSVHDYGRWYIVSDRDENGCPPAKF